MFTDKIPVNVVDVKNTKKEKPELSSPYLYRLFLFVPKANAEIFIYLFNFYKNLLTHCATNELQRIENACKRILIDFFI